MVTIDAAEAQDNVSSLWDKGAEEPLRQAGCGRHLLSGAGISVNDPFTTPIDDAFSDHMPDTIEMAERGKF